MTLKKAWRRETVYFESDIHASPDEFSLRRYRYRGIVTETGSWNDARVGIYRDALEPLSSLAEPADISAITVSASAEPGLRTLLTATGESFELEILDLELPEQRAFPFYSEVNSFDCFKAYNSRGGDTNQALVNPPWHLQGKLTKHAIELARQFGIEPTKQAQHWFDDQNDSEASIVERMEGPYGYLDLVVKGAIAPPLIWCGGLPPNLMSVSPTLADFSPHPFFLRTINAHAPAGSMAWCADEPSDRGIANGMPVEKAIERVRLVQQHAPNLRPMITTGTHVLPRLQELGRGLPIVYAIVQNHDSTDLLPGQKGSYFSCMAQGCQKAAGDKRRTEFPVAVVEGDPINDFQGAIKRAHDNHARFALYYSITKCLESCWKKGGLDCDKVIGGNGDGTAMYVDQETGLAIPSIRMMHWHIKQQEIEKEILG